MLLKWCAIYIWHAQFLSEILHWISCPATNDTARLTAWHESPFLSRKESRSLKSFSKDFEIEELIYDNWKKKKKKTIPCSTRSWRIYPKLALKRDDDNAPLKKKSIEPPSEILSLSLLPPSFLINLPNLHQLRNKNKKELPRIVSKKKKKEMTTTGSSKFRRNKEGRIFTEDRKPPLPLLCSRLKGRMQLDEGGCIMERSATFIPLGSLKFPFVVLGGRKELESRII